MLSPAGPEYALAADCTSLVDFAQVVVLHSHRRRVRELAPSATVAWCDPRRALVRVRTFDDTTTLQDAEAWQLTGLARFEKYGLEFYLADEPAFWHGPDGSLTPVDILCQTLVLGRDSRRLSYAMLLIEHLNLDREQLVDTARWYDMDQVVSTLFQHLGGTDEPSEGIFADLPSESEYMALKHQYKVA